MSSAALHLIAAFCYALAAACAAPAQRQGQSQSAALTYVWRAALALLGAGLLAHAAAFWQLHALSPAPLLTAPPFLFSLGAFFGAAFYLALPAFARVRVLALAVAPLAALACTAAAAALHALPPAAPPAMAAEEVLWPHLHLLFASAALAVLAISAAAACFYLLHHRRLKLKRAPGANWPALETLDRTNSVALRLGFLLLSLGLFCGALWSRARGAGWWPADLHAWLHLLAWFTYAAVVAVRFWRPRTARSSAAAACAAFLILCAANAAARLAA